MYSIRSMFHSIRYTVYIAVLFVVCVTYGFSIRPNTSSERRAEINGSATAINLQMCVIQCSVIRFVKLCPFSNVVW